MKSLVAEVDSRVKCSDIFHEMTKPLSSDCQPHVINAVSRSINPGPKFENWEVDRFVNLGFMIPKFSISNILAPFLTGTTLLKKSSPVWKTYSRLCLQFQMKPVVLRNPASTRWLSVVSYLLLLVHYKEPYNALWGSKDIRNKHRKNAITLELWAHAEALLAELLPLYRVVHHMQRDINRYLLADAIADAANLLILYQRRLQKCIEDGPHDDKAVACLRVHVLNNIVRSLRDHYSFFFQYLESKEHYIFCLLLDPRYLDLDLVAQVNLFDCNPEKVPLGRLQEVKALTETYRESLFSKAASLVKEEPASDAPVLKRKVSFLDATDTLANEPVAAPAQPPLERVRTEWTLYVRKAYTEGVNPFPLRFWPNFRGNVPLLGKVALVYCTMKPSQVPVEGLFSGAGILTMDRRSRTGVDRIDDILYIWANDPRAPSAKPKKPSQALRNRKITLPEDKCDEVAAPATSSAQVDCASLEQLIPLSPSLVDINQALDENLVLEDVATGRNGLVDLPDHLDPVFELENFSVNLDLDLEDLNDELFNDLQGVLMGSQDMS